jgi:hypothetical protein
MHRAMLVQRHRAQRLFPSGSGEIHHCMLRGLPRRTDYSDLGCPRERLNDDDAGKRERRRENELPNSLCGRCHVR